MMGKFRIPGLQVPASADGETRAFFEALKERLELAGGERGDPEQRTVSVRELREAGIAGVRTQNQYARLVTPRVLSGDEGGPGNSTPKDIIDFSTYPRVALTAASSDLQLLVQGTTPNDRFRLAVEDLLTVFGRLDQESAPQLPWSWEAEDYGFDVTGHAPRFRFVELAKDDDIESALPADSAIWDAFVDAGVFELRARDDGDTVGSTAFAIGRTALNIDYFNVYANVLGLPLDGSELQVGAGGDLRLYHNGSNSFIHNSTGDLIIAGATQGATTPANLSMDNEITVLSAQTSFMRASATSGPNLDALFYRDSMMSPSVPQNTNTLGSFRYRAHDGTSAQRTAVTLTGNATEDWIAGIAHGADWTVSTVTAGTITTAPRLRVGGNFAGGYAWFSDGASSQPGISFVADSDTGFYRSASDEVSVANNGVQSFIFGASSLDLRTALPARFNNSANDSAISLSNTGTVGESRLSMTIAATECLAVLSDSALGRDGTAALPGFSFISDPDTGMYRVGANDLAFSTGATERFRIGSNGEWGLAGANYGAAGEVLTSNGSSAAPTWQAAGVGGGGVANPTATIGLTAVNGTATTAIRSDGAPALSQAIVPTWTGLHTWSNATPSLRLFATGAPSNRKDIRLVATATGQLQLNSYNDAETFMNSLIVASRASGGFTSTAFGHNNGTVSLAGTTLNLQSNGATRLSLTNTGNLAVTAATEVNVAAGGVDVGRFDSSIAPGNTRLLVFDVDNNTLERVSVGAADSGGIGFKVLRIAN